MKNMRYFLMLISTLSAYNSMLSIAWPSSSEVGGAALAIANGVTCGPACQAARSMSAPKAAMVVNKKGIVLPAETPQQIIAQASKLGDISVQYLLSIAAKNSLPLDTNAQVSNMVVNPFARRVNSDPNEERTQINLLLNPIMSLNKRISDIANQFATSPANAEALAREANSIAQQIAAVLLLIHFDNPDKYRVAQIIAQWNPTDEKKNEKMALVASMRNFCQKEAVNPATDKFLGEKYQECSHVLANWASSNNQKISSESKQQSMTEGKNAAYRYMGR